MYTKPGCHRLCPGLYENEDSYFSGPWCHQGLLQEAHGCLQSSEPFLSMICIWWCTQCHATTSFNMNYIEYRQREIFLISSDIFWLSHGIRKKFIPTCIMYKKMDLLAKISTKSSKVIQKWAVQYDLYK